MLMISVHTGSVFIGRKQIKYQLIVTDHEDEDLASLNPYNQLPMLVEQNLKLFSAPIIAEYLDDRYRQNKLYADAPMARAEQRQYIWRLENDWFKLADHMLRHADTLNIEQNKSTKELRDTLISLTLYFSISLILCPKIFQSWTVCLLNFCET